MSPRGPVGTGAVAHSGSGGSTSSEAPLSTRQVLRSPPHGDAGQSGASQAGDSIRLGSAAAGPGADAGDGDRIRVGSGAAGSASGSVVQGSGSSVQSPSAMIFASPPRTRSQHGILKPKVCTDGTVRYDKGRRFAGLAVTGEPNTLVEALENKN